VPATRLLVVADSKMLAALANGLREGGKFDVLTVPLAEIASAEAAAERADALVIFYGTPDKALPAALQALSPKVRERGGRVVAVLQREQAALRDECFKAGASDLLYMPMPKDQFLARLVSSVGLSWAPEAGTPAAVSVATRTATSKVEYAAVSPAGVESPGELPMKTGETVRVTWATFQAWGLVVRGGPSVQIRFAGLAPDEEALIRDWLKGGGKAAVAGPAVPAPPAAAPKLSAVPQGGPPPGFADRKPIRPQTQARPTPRITPPLMAPVGNGASAAPFPSAPKPAADKTPPAKPVPVGKPAAPAAEAKPVLAGLFDESAAAPEAAAEAAPSGPSWPSAVQTAVAKAAAFEFIRSRTVPADMPSALAASAKKIAGMLSSGERAALEKAGPESHFADALAARISLDAATTEGVVLYSSKGKPNVDSAAITTLTQMADLAAARLQQEANAAIGKNQVEQLQMITAASAALSRDVLSFKETADRLRGVGSSHRLGAGGLDPDMILPGQQARPRTVAAPSGPLPVRAELRDFQGLEARGGSKKGVLILTAVLFAAALAYGTFAILPRTKVIPADAAGPNVVRIEVSGPSALVTVTQAWADNPQPQLGKLLEVLKSLEVQSAIIRLPSGANVGVLDVKGLKLVSTGKPPAAPK
jgi:CheY-like chemotaxis protein